MVDQMFFSKDEKSLIRGSRVHPRTETCRPCVVEMDSDPEVELHGVVLDVTPLGMLVRMVHPIALTTQLNVQLMRDDQFQKKLSTPHIGIVRRIEETADGFYDHGLELMKDQIVKASERPIHIEPNRPSATRAPSRMQTADKPDRNPNR